MRNKYVYVPALKFKDAEVFAFSKLREDQKANIIPLFQLVHQYWYEKRKDKDGKLIRIRHKLSSAAVLQNVLAEIRRKLSDFKLFLDVSIMFPDQKELAWKEISDSPVTLFGNKMIIVLTLNDLQVCKPDASVLSFFEKNGIALRVTKGEISDEFWNSVNGCLGRVGLSRNNVDLIFDYQLYDQNTQESVRKLFSHPELFVGWRSITLLCGSFTMKDLSEIKKPGNYDLKREDWLLWNEIIGQMSNGENLNINYGDYTIQYPIYFETPADVRGSRSVRYAKEQKWVIQKGLTDNAKNSAKTKQYLGHALVLVGQSIHCGKECCWGDKFIFDISNRTSKEYGGLSTWLRVGINHHLSLTTGQLASLGQISD